MKLNVYNKQLEVIKSPALLKLVIAARGSGKSFLMIVAAIKAAMDYKSIGSNMSIYESLLTAPTLKRAKNTFYKPLLELLKDQPFITNINKTDLQFTFTSGAILTIESTEGGGERLRGKNSLFVGIDEVQDVALSTITDIKLPLVNSNRLNGSSCIVRVHFPG